MTYTSSLDRPLRTIPAQRVETALSLPPTVVATTDNAHRLMLGGTGDKLLSIHHSQRVGYTLVRLVGQMDLMSFDLLRRTLLRLLIQSGPCLVVDMGEVTFTDARGISPLVTARRLADECGGWVRLARVNDRVRRVLDAGRLTRLLPAYPTVADAAAGTGMIETFERVTVGGA